MEEVLGLCLPTLRQREGRPRDLPHQDSRRLPVLGASWLPNEAASSCRERSSFDWQGWTLAPSQIGEDVVLVKAALTNLASAGEDVGMTLPEVEK